MAPPHPEPFTRWARLYDALYEHRGLDAAGETARLVAKVEGLRGGAAGTGPLRWLDAGCGTGRHLRHVPARWARVGVDRNAAMLAVARERARGARLVRGDLRALPFAAPPRGAGFDAVTCLFGSVGYIEDAPTLARCLGGLAALLRAGGVVAVEPPVTEESFRPPETSETAFVHEGVAVRRVMDAEREGAALRVRFRFEVGEERWEEQHRLLLAPAASYRDALAAAGLDVRHEPAAPGGRDLFLGLRAR